jgi:exodeoxyribonuclease-3
MRRTTLLCRRAGAASAKAWIPRVGGAVDREQAVGAHNTGLTGDKTSAFTLLSMNVAGLRGVLRSPEKSAALRATVAAVRPHLLCLQEHKLQDEHVADATVALRELLGGDLGFSSRAAPSSSLFACSGPPARKGYSGTACLLSDALPTTLLDSWSGFPAPLVASRAADADTDSVHAEGRLVTLEFQDIVVVNTYTPNSGSKLARLPHRVAYWDKIMAAYLDWLERHRGKPVCLVGDLNVAHKVQDIHNFYSRPGFPDQLPEVGAKDHFKGVSALKQQAGCTAEERLSFTALLASGSGYVDAFRHLHPDALGRFSYWSQRAGNRRWNRGLRIDYCVVSACLLAEGVTSGSLPRLHSSFICDDEAAYPPFSDHAPVGASFLLF